ncbi:MAG: nucleoside hydrolase [Blastocatellia bacterium]|nr:nucleoside hydrolase [Blastocatellia bacterium]
MARTGRLLLTACALLTLCGASVAAQTAARVPVILSTDVGNEVDDQWTIAWLLLSPRVEVLGVMSAQAPTIAAPAGRTSYRILRDVVENRLAMRVHPPLIEGGSLPLENAQTPRPSPAVRFLIEKSKPFTRENRLTVLMIGAATDVASAILTDPTITGRIRVIQMGFTNRQGGNEFNIANDPRAAQAILDSDVPLVIGPGDVCRASLSLGFQQAEGLLAARGPIGAWLWEEFQAWYFRYVKPIRVNDFSKPWIIWDNITLAYVLGMTSHQTAPRPRMQGDFTFVPGAPGREVTWITDVDEERMWADFFSLLDDYQRTHKVSHNGLRPRLTFGMP